MSKSIAVATAVAGQLLTDGWHPPYDFNKAMSQYRYDTDTISIFLRAVQDHLRNGNPAYNFNFDTAFAHAALSWDIVALIAHVDINTQ
jgi:hypothetical protein